MEGGLLHPCFRVSHYLYLQQLLLLSCGILKLMDDLQVINHNSVSVC